MDTYELTELLKYTLPAVVVLVTAYLLMKKFVEYNTKHLVVLQQNYELEKQKLNVESKRKREEAAIPLRLQAYERMVLFLERINPPNLIVRELQSGMNAQTFHVRLIESIRDEFEHNLSQQIYLSDESWVMVKAAKEAVVSLINKAASEVDKNAPAVQLGEKILSYTFEKGKDPIEKALSVLKQDVRKQFLS